LPGGRVATRPHRMADVAVHLRRPQTATPRLARRANRGILIVDTELEDSMQTRVQRWGNSLAVRIPKSFAEEVGLQDNSPVNLRLSQGKLVLEPSTPRAPSLEELLAGVRRSNLHAEFDTGPARGREAW